MAAFNFPDTTGKPTDGSFTYSSPDGTVYKWVGYAWQVQESSGGGGGGGGGGAARVTTQVFPPSPAEDGDMYWCTDDGRLYIYYNEDTTDPNPNPTSQWVDASPENTLAQYWSRTGDTLSPTADGDSVDMGSGNITAQGQIGSGDVDLGPYSLLFPDGRIEQATDSSSAYILRNKTSGAQVVNFDSDGSATFSGPVSVFSNSADKARVVSNGYFESNRSAGTSSVLDGSLNGTTTTSILASGEASFAGLITGFDATLGLDPNTNFVLTGKNGTTARTTFSVTATGTTRIGTDTNNSSGTNITLGTDGSASFAGQFDVNAVTSGSGGCRFTPDGSLISRPSDDREGTASAIEVYSNGYTSNDRTFLVKKDGSATFAGGIDTAQYISINRTVSDNAYALGIFGNSTGLKCFIKGSGLYVGSALGNANGNPSGAKTILASDGSASFAGNVTAPNTFFNLEADDDTKYTTTTDEDGVETRVYNGATLDVKQMLLDFQAKIQTLEAAKTALEARVVTLETQQSSGNE